MLGSTNVANKINYDIADFNFTRREKVHPGYFSGYKRFFRGTKWHVFLAPANDLGYSLVDAKSRGVNAGLWDVPGVYEFAVAKSPSATRYKTYVGTTRSVRDRHGSYLRDGDHLKHFLDTAVKNGLFVMRRIRYIIPKPQLPPRLVEQAAVIAEQTETRFLGKYDYPWNSRQNGNVAMTRIPIKKSFLCMFSRIGWVRHSDFSKFAAR
jgi:hypothetical protein